jgi:hypothetical protein
MIMDIVKIFSLKFTQRSYWHNHGKPAGMLGSASIFGRLYTCEPVAMLQGKLARARLDRPQYVHKSSHLDDVESERQASNKKHVVWV